MSVSYDLLSICVRNSTLKYHVQLINNGKQTLTSPICLTCNFDENDMDVLFNIYCV